MKTVKIYLLFYKETTYELKISPMPKEWRLNPSFDYSKINIFNDCHFVSSDKKLLKEKALELKAQWIKNAEDSLNKANSCEIVMKY